MNLDISYDEGGLMKTTAIIQARMGSSRLPGKILINLMGKTILQHVIERVLQVKSIQEVIIATTTLEQDNVVIDEALKCGVDYFRGSVDDVLSRYYFAAKKSRTDIVVRITSDCPLIDPIVTENIINFYKEKMVFDLVTNAGSESNRTFPRGLDTEVFSFDTLEKAYKKADKQYQREHVTPYIYENSPKIYFYKNIHDYSQYRLTLDTKDDFELIKTIYENLYKNEHNFYLPQIIELFDRKPELIDINKHVEQKKLIN